MKRMVVGIAPIALLFALIMGCMSAPPPPAASDSGMDQLDPAIREASDYLNGRIPRGVKAVFLNIRSDYPDLSEYILSDLSTNAVNDGVFSVVDRAQLDALRAEMNFQLSGEVDDNSAQEIGKMLGAQTIVSGTVSKVGSLYRLEVKAIEVQTAGVQGQWRKNISSGEIIAALTENVVPASTGGAVTAQSASPAASGEPTTAAGSGAQAPAVTQTPAAPAPVTYNIGDTGPAGGIIFYDKGNNSGGWRYLEVAPAETEKNAAFFINYSQRANSYLPLGVNTEDGLGAGKKNTDIICTYLASNGQWDMSAQVCAELEVNGYDDWYLPSFMELSLIYGNLHRKGLGNFQSNGGPSGLSAVYYSSTLKEVFNGFRILLSMSFNFADGSSNAYYTEGAKPVRAIRQF